MPRPYQHLTANGLQLLGQGPTLFSDSPSLMNHIVLLDADGEQRVVEVGGGVAGMALRDDRLFMWLVRGFDHESGQWQGDMAVYRWPELTMVSSFPLLPEAQVKGFFLI